MKAVIYARFSSEKQNEASIEGQLRECIDYANFNNIEIIGNYIDRAQSAKTDHRPEFQRMIKDSYKHAFNCIIVWKLDRFARNRYDSAYYKNVLKKNGVRVISAKESISQGADGILLESILEGYAEYYSAELSEKVKRGMTENALKAKSNGVRPPFGYYVDDTDHYQIDETISPIIKEIFNLYVDGVKVTEIVDKLKERGVKNRGYELNYNAIFVSLPTANISVSTNLAKLSYLMPSLQLSTNRLSTPYSSAWREIKKLLQGTEARTTICLRQNCSAASAVR